MTLKTFSLGWILETLAEQEGLNVQTENIDDVVFGMVISSDKTALQVFRDLLVPYNFQIVDGDPIRLVRRAVNDDLLIDLEIDESECIRRGDSPAISLTRVEPSKKPRQVEIQYIDPDRLYAYNTQVARHTAAPLTNSTLSLSLDLVISSQQARDIAFDALYRIWSQGITIKFEHTNLLIEPGDVVRLTSRSGVFLCLVTNSTINMPGRTNSIEATILLASKGVTVNAPTADPFTPGAVSILTEDGDEWVTEDDLLILTEG